MTMEKLLVTFGRTGIVTVSPMMREQFKRKLDEIGARYTERWDEQNKIYVFVEREDMLI